MGAIIGLRARVGQEIIEPALKPAQLKETAATIGLIIEENFVQSEISKLTSTIFFKLKPKIESFLQTEMAKQLYFEASSLDVESTFKPLIEERLKTICKVIPGSCNAYAPGPTLWTWLASWNTR